MIAPFWSYWNTTKSGVISYRQVTSGGDLQQATSDINQYFPQLNFTATWVFIVTWDSVAFNNMDTETSFQVVLISDGNQSFVLMNYGRISSVIYSMQAGFVTADSMIYFSMMEYSSYTDLTFSSNVNVKGRWVFQTNINYEKGPFLPFGTNNGDTQQYIPKNFYPFGPNNGDTVNPAVDDGSSSVILLNETFQFFGSNHNQLYVNNNGFLTFDQPVSSPYSSMFQSGYDIIAPSWSNWNTTKSGIISYRQVTSGGDLQQATSDINQYFPQLNFTATWVFIATWDNVAFYNMDTVRTDTSFQVVLISDGNHSFVLMNYGRISSVISYLQAGFVTADSMIYFNILQYSSYTDLTFSSNVNVKGRWVFQTNINYEKVTSGSVLEQATSDILQYFPELNFTATWVFIVTWNVMEYYPTMGNNTMFQVVLVSDGHLSFIMMNYGNLAPKTQSVQVGYDTFNSTNYFNMPESFQSNITSLSFTSNVNVTGRWVFRTDSCPNNCLFQENFYPFGPNNGDTVNPAVDDGSSSVILLNETFQFFGSDHNQLYVNNNGFLTFDQPVSNSYPSMFQSGYDIIAPLWSNWNTTKSGVISYRQATSGGDLQQATSDINQYFPQLNFTATWVFIATWDSVAYGNMDTP
ncbi:uncharacterized protein LOC108923745 [Scleropages formosus]|uniref:uncharacterized protein LOC108923745 n=1 Tax=Scleropages formosus TaxID=113540 RepID=UPI0010FA99D6|nr:uncharacterized protein LOC108923745 [Scleropages formosus]